MSASTTLAVGAKRLSLSSSPSSPDAANDAELLQRRRQTTKERSDADGKTSSIASARGAQSEGSSSSVCDLSSIRDLLDVVKEDIKVLLYGFKEEIVNELRSQVGLSTLSTTDTGPPPPPVSLGKRSLFMDAAAANEQLASSFVRPQPLDLHGHGALPEDQSFGSDFAWSDGSPSPSHKSLKGRPGSNPASPESINGFKSDLFEQAHKEKLRSEYTSENNFGCERQGSADSPGSPHSKNGFGRGQSNRSMASSGSITANINLASQGLRQQMRRTRHRNACAVKTWIFFEDPDFFAWGRMYVRAMAFAIMVSAALPLMQAIEPPPLNRNTQGLCEICLDCIFTLEWAARFYSCPNILGFILNPYNCIDALVAMVPLFLRLSQGITISVTDARAENRIALLVLLAQMPVLRMLKLLRRFQSFHLILKAFRMALEALPMLIYNLTILLLLFGTTIYIVEPSIDTLGDAIWLTIVTIGTVGYGDVVPKSTAGVVVVSLLIVTSALYMAIPLGIVGSAFVEVWNDRDRLLLLHRTRTRFATNGYGAKDIPQIFVSFDKDGDGQLTITEFTRMMRSLEIDFSKARIEALFESFDADGSGALDDQEFVKAIFPWAYSDIYGSQAGDDNIDSDFGFPRLESPTDDANEDVQVRL